MILTLLKSRDFELIKNHTDLISISDKKLVIKHIVKSVRSSNLPCFKLHPVLFEAYDFIMNCDSRDMDNKRLLSLSSKLYLTTWDVITIKEWVTTKILFNALLSLNDNASDSFSNLISYYVSSLDHEINYDDFLNLSKVIENNIKLL